MGASSQEVIDASPRSGRTRLIVWDGDRPRDAYLA